MMISLAAGSGCGLQAKSHISSQPLSAEPFMQNVITVEKKTSPSRTDRVRRIVRSASSPEFKSDGSFKTRIVLLNRDTAVAEIAIQEFADAR
jgi:hypothetical protein